MMRLPSSVVSSGSRCLETALTASMKVKKRTYERREEAGEG